LGAYLDPIADKLLLSSSFVILAYKQPSPGGSPSSSQPDILILIVAIVIILFPAIAPFRPHLWQLTTFFEIVVSSRRCWCSVS